MAGGSLVVSKVAAGSQAEAAGLKLGFILTAIGGKSLAEMMKVNLVVCGTAGEETGRLGCHFFRDWPSTKKTWRPLVIVDKTRREHSNPMFRSFSIGP